MRIRQWWAALVEQAQRLLRDTRPGSNARRVRPDVADVPAVRE